LRGLVPGSHHRPRLPPTSARGPSTERNSAVLEYVHSTNKLSFISLCHSLFRSQASPGIGMRQVDLRTATRTALPNPRPRAGVTVGGRSTTANRRSCGHLTNRIIGTRSRYAPANRMAELYSTCSFSP
jgi:hypothetical protein